MPLYTYRCEDCDASLEILHAVGKTRATCGLDCRLQGPGTFGAGRIVQGIDAANVATRSKAADGTSPNAFADMRREALRHKALQRLGNEISEGELNTLRDKGITVYRKDGEQSWAKDGGDAQAPERIRPGSSDE